MMRFRYTLLLSALGLITAAYLRDVHLTFFVLFGLCVLRSLRNIEYQIGDLKGRISPSKPAKSAKSTNATFDELVAHAFGKSTLEMKEKIHREFYQKPNLAVEIADAQAFRESLDRVSRQIKWSKPQPGPRRMGVDNE